MAGWGDIGQPADRIDYVSEDDSWVNRKFDLWRYDEPDTHQHAVLPEGSSVISATGYGGSFWSQTGKILVRLAEGTTETYLIKVCTPISCANVTRD